MISDVKNFHHYRNGNTFFGQHGGMRFVIEPIKDENEEKHLQVDIWPDPFARDKTPPEQHKLAIFDFNQAGLDELKAWMLAEYEGDIEKWNAARTNPWV